MSTDVAHNPWPGVDSRIDLGWQLAQLNSDTADMVIMSLCGFSQSNIAARFGFVQSTISRRLQVAFRRIRNT